MARLPDELIERIKQEVKLVDLCREYGIVLSGKGKNLFGKCPLHEDESPSFAVTPGKNLWNCLAGCGGGDTIALVMAMEKVSFRRAAEKLAARLGVVPEAEVLTTREGTAHEILATPGDGLSDPKLMGMVADFYHATFLNQPRAMQYLEKRKCFHPEAAKRFKIGYANRTLGYRVPRTTKAGRELKEQLTRLGIYGKKGHEHLNGSVVFPLLDEGGKVVQIYGRKLHGGLRPGTPEHLYLEQPKRGVWNREGIEKQREWLLCESIMDALTLWCHGFRNATCAFGVNGFNDDLWRLLERAKPERVVICYDNDEPGNKAAGELAKKLAGKGMATLRAHLPEGGDVNSLAVESRDARRALATAIENPKSLVASSKAPKAPTEKTAASFLAASKKEISETPRAEGASGCNVTLLGKVSLTKKRADELHAVIGDRSYRIRGLAKNLSYETMKVQLKVTFGENFHLDNGFDLCAHKAREHFVKAAAVETGLQPGILKRDLGNLLLALEELQEEIIRKASEPQSPTAPELDEEERKEALALLTDPNLLGRILEDFDLCGVVGEFIWGHSLFVGKA